MYEKDIKDVKLNQSVKIISEAYPNEIFSSKVTFIDPSINPETRTIRVRTEFKNPNGKLKPQMYVKASILEVTKKALTIPASSVIHTGKRNVVWVEVKENTFEPRDVKLGIDDGSYVEVISGLNEGEFVVVTGGYLIDSESQLQQPASAGVHQHGSGAGSTTTMSAEEMATTVKIIVDGTYKPDVIHAKKGQKLTIYFERHDESKCTEEVVFKDFNIRKMLPSHKITKIEITPKETGEFRFTCGMEMLEGKLVVE
ncbi:MAG: cupredoxin domain-containing protein [Bacteroidetes bacterium]|nr:cupredoxin domain-containing protein [Bacteroidota bacterium]MBU1422187.1 cupredoxin domain-containing protein [Bacteroidota bacterium]MBU2470949.1 cupredoxin domain-containing protein [Bacteroidota bacterium]MBU2636640.1 cupredoxin domain-containing protein [Bacteroidota bacterium]